MLYPCLVSVMRTVQRMLCATSLRLVCSLRLWGSPRSPDSPLRSRCAKHEAPKHMAKVPASIQAGFSIYVINICHIMTYDIEMYTFTPPLGGMLKGRNQWSTFSFITKNSPTWQPATMTLDIPRSCGATWPSLQGLPIVFSNYPVHMIDSKMKWKQQLMRVRMGCPLLHIKDSPQNMQLSCILPFSTLSRHFSSSHQKSK